MHYNTVLVPQYDTGDINGDGTVNIKDSNLMKRILISNYSPDYRQFNAADINKDGSVNTKDAFMLKKMLIG